MFKRWIQSFFVRAASPPAPITFFFFCEHCMACESQTYEVNPILICKCSKPISPYDMVWHIKLKYKRDESHPILQEQELIHTYDLLLRKLCSTWVICKQGDSILFFASAVRTHTPMAFSFYVKLFPLLFPPSPSTFLFVKIAFNTRVKHKKVNTTFFVCIASQPLPMTSSMWKLHGESNVNCPNIFP